MNIKNIFSYNGLLFSVFVVLLVSSFTLYGFTERVGKKIVFEDFDGDGLSNAEEEIFETDPHNPDTDGDGYSDGVEIESGYDPLKPAPGDRIVNEEVAEEVIGIGGLNDNLIADFSEEIGSFVEIAQSGSLEGFDQEKLDQEISAFVGERLDGQELPEVNQDRIFIKNQDYPELTDEEKKLKIKEDAIAYTTATAYIFDKTLPDGFLAAGEDEFMYQLTANTQILAQDPSAMDYFTDLGDGMLAAEDALYDLSAPDTMLDLHVEMLQMLEYNGQISNSIEEIDIANDSLAFFIQLSLLQESLNTTKSIIDRWTQRIGELGVDTEELGFEDSIVKPN